MVFTTISRAASRVFRFYADGFRGMVLGKTLWKIILIKLAVMFLILRLFFFPDYLKSRFRTQQERSQHVLEQLTQP